MVVSATDGPLPQTVEQLKALKAQGAGSVDVVISNSELVDTELLELVELEIRDLAAQNGLAVGSVDRGAGRHLRPAVLTWLIWLIRLRGTAARMTIAGVTPTRWTAATVTGLVLVALLGLGTSSAETPVHARASDGTLSVTPSEVVSGQAVRFTGNIGAPGRRAIHLQWNMNRPGDIWIDVADTGHRTDRRGRFDFTFPAPSALGLPIGLRVVGGQGLKTPAYQLKARPQELTLSLAGAQPDQMSYGVLPGLPFDVVVDTTPSVRSSMGTPPAFPGRAVSLQRRVDGNRWQTVGTGGD